MSTLYELTDEYLKLLEMAEDPDVDEEAFQDTLEGLDGEIEIKADGYAKIIKQLELNVEGCAAEIGRLQNVKKVYENNVSRIKASLEKAMRETGKVKFKTNLFSFGIKKNPASLVIDDDHAIPPEYIIIEQKANKTAIKQAIKKGETFDWARLEQSESLNIR